MQFLNADLSGKYTVFNFYKDGKIIPESPVCGMTLKSAGSMRFRWAEKNPVRENLLNKIAEDYGNKFFVPVQLNHTKIVYDIKGPEDTDGKIGDGIITENPDLIPTITVADCVPLFLYDPVTGVYGIVHSGWKGTGIIAEALFLAEKNYGSRPEDFLIVIGPHINDCCYIVNEERALYFAENFTPECVTPLEENGVCKCGGRGLPVVWNNGGGKLYRLSLQKANLAVLEKAGVPSSNITCIKDCTCCNLELGSNRRETAENGRTDAFTVQAAFIIKK